jgi:hypothetical protein
VSNEFDVNGPIGIFDSGFGGLTVARAVIDLLPNEDIVYIGDHRFNVGKTNDLGRSPFDLHSSHRQVLTIIISN